MKQTKDLTHVNSWFPAVYRQCHVTNVNGFYTFPSLSHDKAFAKVFPLGGIFKVRHYIVPTGPMLYILSTLI